MSTQVSRNQPARLAALAAPGVFLGVVGMTHPPTLTYASSHHWWVMHVLGLFAFPLVSAAFVALVWRRRDPLALAVVLGAAAFAYLYTALDVISGVAAGYVTHRAGPGPRPEAVRSIFRIGGDLGTYGEYGLVLAVLALSADVVRRRQGAVLRALPAVLLLVAGAAGVVEDHIYRPWGALGAIALGLGTAAAGWATAARSSGSPGSSPGSRNR